MKEVSLKLANMRKPQEFVNYGISDRNTVIIQSDKSIGEFDLLTGKGKLNTKGCYFHHLAFASSYDLTVEQLEIVKSALIMKGDKITNSPFPIIFGEFKTI